MSLDETPEVHNFADQSYWNEHYKNDSSPFEWYTNWETIRDTIKGLLIYTGRCVHVGCGTSSISYDLVKEGFMSVKCIDFSDVVIEKMKEKYADEMRLEFVCGDCTSLNVSASSENCVFDKGTQDAMTTCERSTERIAEYLKEVHRVLALNGSFVMISFAPPEVRVRYFRPVEKQLVLKEVRKIPKPCLEDAYHYAYVFKKVIPELDDNEDE